MASEILEGIGHVEKAVYRHAVLCSCCDFPAYGPFGGKGGGETAVTAASAVRLAGGSRPAAEVSRVALYSSLIGDILGATNTESSTYDSTSQ